ncbi:MAG: hypothetical protein F6J95_027925 [Leptolyngbya sp. SIO1E4]|nr:hypothetical protein [Leptolyngbya sp. SIO1E4]
MDDYPLADSLYLEEMSPGQMKLLKKAEEFHTYIANNQQFIPNYGERYRNGERIATGFAVSQHQTLTPCF